MVRSAVGDMPTSGLTSQEDRCISSRLQPLTVKVILIDNRLMEMKLKHTLGSMLPVGVYGLIELCEIVMFYL